MTDYTVIRTETRPNGTYRVWRRNEDDGTFHTNTFHPDIFAGRGAEYGLTDPAEILDVILHEAFAGSVDDSPRDDHAAAAGWVTTTDPDAEPVRLYNARSTADALGAHRARVKGSGHRVTDPDGHLARFLEGISIDWNLHRKHREFVDTMRWHKIYGGLPLPEPRPASNGRIPIPQGG